MLQSGNTSYPNSSAKAPAVRKGKSAAMILETPPSPWTLAKWHSKKISGVPFLLRNILTAQRAGVDRLTIHYKDGAELENLAETVRDSRIKLTLDWVSDSGQFIGLLKTGNFNLLLDGSTLHDRSKIAKLLNIDLLSPSDREEIPKVSLEKLGDLLTSEKLMTSGSKTGIIPEKISENSISDSPVFLAGGEEARVIKEDDFRVQHERLLQACGLSNDSFMDRLITRRVSRQLTRLFLRTPLTPNQITGLSFLLGLGSAFMFYLGNYTAGVGGGALLLLSAWVDCTDGEIARLKFQETQFGSGLDIISDNLVHFAAFYGIGMGLYFSTGEGIYKIFGFLAVLGSALSFSLMHSKVVKGKSQATEGKENSSEPDLAAHIANRDFTYILFLMAIVDQLGFFIALTAVGSNVFAAYLVYSRLKLFLMTTDKFCSKNSEKE